MDEIHGIMNITELLDDHNVRYKRTGESKNVREGWIGLNCPSCGHGNDKFHLGINLENVHANCWSCGPANLMTVLCELTGLTYREIQKLLGDTLQRRASFKTPHTGRLRLPEGRLPLAPIHLRYLKGRGLDGPLLARIWGIQGIGFVAARLRYRIWIPIHQNGEIVSWTTRSVGSDICRYISAKPEESAVPIKDILFGADYARHAIIPTEGPFDVFKIGPGAVATLGVNYSNTQMIQMGRYAVRAVCFDNEPAAQKRAKQLCNSLAQFPGRTENVILTSGSDPGDADPAEIAQLRAEYLGDPK